MTDARVVVVGGGLAGLSAAVECADGGAAVTLVEAHRWLGGATASFAPPSVTGSGSTAMSVGTAASTPAGTYTLHVTGTSGPVSHSADVTLVVNTSGDFSVSASPASRTINNGETTTFNVTITPGQGFSSNVTLSVSSLPRFVTGTFQPASLPSGTAALTLNTKKQVKSGSYTVVVTATAGSLSHSANVTLVVQ